MPPMRYARPSSGAWHPGYRTARLHRVQAQLRARRRTARSCSCTSSTSTRATKPPSCSAWRDDAVRPAPDTRYHPVGQAPATLRDRPVVVGFGPCGLFAALLLAQMGFKPIVLERGRDVRRRTQDTWALWRQKTLTPESNVQFGEGGAGLFSDGKLYSQIKDPKFYGRKVMHEFVRAGAPAEILYVSKPHIGTFRLTGVVAAMREEIIALGGEVRFESRVTDLLIERRPDRGRGARQTARRCTAVTWCWRWATARATPSACCIGAASSWKPSPLRSAFASSIRNR